MILLAMIFDFFASSFFESLSVIIFIVLLSHKYRFQRKRFLVMCFLIGLLYDCLFNNFLFLNATLFTLIGYISLKRRLDDELILSLSLVTLYKLSLYFVLVSLRYIKPDLFMLVTSLFFCIIFNGIIYFVVYFASKRHIII